jgi:hypothetical protein
VIIKGGSVAKLDDDMSDEERMPSLRSLQIPSIGHTMPTAKQKDRNKSEESFRSLTLAIKPGVGREQQASLDFCLAPLFEIGKQVTTSGVGLRTFPNCVHLHTLPRIYHSTIVLPFFQVGFKIFNVALTMC